MLPEVILSTKFLKSEIRKVHLEARDIPLHAGIIGMDISTHFFILDAVWAEYIGHTNYYV